MRNVQKVLFYKKLFNYHLLFSIFRSKRSSLTNVSPHLSHQPVFFREMVKIEQGALAGGRRSFRDEEKKRKK